MGLPPYYVSGEVNLVPLRLIVYNPIVNFIKIGVSRKYNGV